MRKYPPGVAATGLLMVLLLPLAAAQKWLVCPDGERFEIFGSTVARVPSTLKPLRVALSPLAS